MEKHMRKKYERVKRTRNAGTWTESRYWQQVRGSLRRGFRYWKPAQDALTESRRAYRGSKKTQKWEYMCADCKEFFTRKEVEVDHIHPVGSIRNGREVARFLRQLTPEKGFQVLCKQCHREKTNRERKK